MKSIVDTICRGLPNTHLLHLKSNAVERPPNGGFCDSYTTSFFERGLELVEVAIIVSSHSVYKKLWKFLSVHL